MDLLRSLFSAPPAREPLGLRCVCISDTHGQHRKLEIPDGDILIHAGDWTHFGKRSDAEDFNAWLGTLPHKHKIVVNGNHESNAPWKKDTKKIFTNATFLLQESVEVEGVTIFGAEFCWPTRDGNPYMRQIPAGTDIVVVHGPVKGYVDGNYGCQDALQEVRRVGPRLVVSGHIHEAHGEAEGHGIKFVNAANCLNGYKLGSPAIVVDI
eukprot:m.55959 g.55959  ORF g.55959 m.55959 type:complete len:209 (+) comp15661_c1_seq2:130-756(+)